MLAGSFCTAAAVLPPIASHDELFPVHVGQHLLLGMAAPAFLALSAPVTLALRTLPRRPRRILLRLLHGFPVAVLAAPATAVVLDLGGLYALYLTGLYQAAEHDDLVHAAVHIHMFLAGCLLSWAVIGLDPVRRRPGTWVRLTALIIAAAGHDTLAKLIYAWPDQALAGVEVIGPQRERPAAPAGGLGVQPQQQRIQLWIVAAVCGGLADLGEPQVMAAAGRVLFEENMADALVRDLSGA
jgi:cytochrome c oxidase assembly factor CtaG